MNYKVTEKILNSIRLVCNLENETKYKVNVHEDIINVEVFGIKLDI